MKKKIELKDVVELGQLEVLNKAMAIKDTIRDLIDLRASQSKDEGVAWDFFEELAKKNYPSYDKEKHSLEVSSKDCTLVVKDRGLKSKQPTESEATDEEA